MNKTGFLNAVLQSIFYKSSFLKASTLSKNSKGILLLLGTAFTKAQAEGGSPVKKIMGKLESLGKLLKYYANGSYRSVSTKNIVAILAGLIYFVSPIDLVPDFLPVIGFADDIALILFIFNSVEEEITKFEYWLRNKNIEITEEKDIISVP